MRQQKFPTEMNLTAGLSCPLHFHISIVLAKLLYVTLLTLICFSKSVTDEMT